MKQDASKGTLGTLALQGADTSVEIRASIRNVHTADLGAL